MILRETLEWTDTWWEQANDNDCPRALLVGDSITRGYRPFVQEKLAGSWLIDQFATSKYVCDPFYQKELSLYLSEYRYTCIHFNHGLHGVGFSSENYCRYYSEILELVLSHCPSVILALSTPITKAVSTAYSLDDDNNLVICRNSFVQEISEKYRLPINDLYTPLLGKVELLVGDRLHYTPEGYRLLGDITAQAILAQTSPAE